jgi:hypothetical protein
LFLLSSIKASGRFFQIFVTFSEKLNFTAGSSEKDTIIGIWYRWNIFRPFLFRNGFTTFKKTYPPIACHAYLPPARKHIFELVLQTVDFWPRSVNVDKISTLSAV